MNRINVGDHIKRTSNPARWAPIGYETVATGKPDEITYTDCFGKNVMILRQQDWTSIKEEGPVITETVTTTRIVPGVYDGVTVDQPGERDVHVSFEGFASADELDAAIAVLSKVSKALRDAN